MSNTFAGSFNDIQALFSMPCSSFQREHPGRFQSVLRKQEESDDLAGMRNVLHEGTSRFMNAEYAGIGSDGFVLRVQACAYYERFGIQAALSAYNRGGEVIVKVRKVPESNKVTVIRELFVGVMVRAHSLPFLSGISRWWVWSGFETSCGAFTCPSTGGISSYLSADTCDITDFLPHEARRQVRGYYCLGNGAVVEQYVEHCRRDTAGRYRVMMEYEAAGSCSLDSFMTRERILCTQTRNNWHFFRSMMLTLGQQLGVLQQRCHFMHGDLSAANVVLQSLDYLPRDFGQFFTVDAGAFRSLRPDDLAVGAHVRGAFPTMIDLSRASFSDEFVHSTVSYYSRVVNPADFEAVAWQPTHGATERAPIGAFLPSLDIHRLGLSLAHIVFRVLYSDDPHRHISIQTMDVRIVNAIIRMLDMPAAWLTYTDFRKPRPGNLCGTYAKTDQMHRFLVKLLYIVDTLSLLAEAIVSQAPADYNRVKERHPVFSVIWNHINYDLNDWMGWIKKANPDCDRDDVCRPEHFVRWDVWCQ